MRISVFVCVASAAAPAAPLVPEHWYQEAVHFWKSYVRFHRDQCLRAPKRRLGLIECSLLTVDEDLELSHLSSVTVPYWKRRI